jgi:hypothetical protein
MKKPSVRDIAFLLAIAMIFGGLWSLFGLAVASVTVGVLELALLLLGIMLPPERKQ